ncbi:hypothetical protein PKOR_15870 [Pontibacter korlensis]|uniref:Uncharacterized protein n=1 Tax=Pontibacter korlensis TaxID=400092 RepID=A0A0E3UYB1_9BACT|nr:hypothetical protein PKOR_15870 [Pontibacter korlensis]
MHDGLGYLFCFGDIDCRGSRKKYMEKAPRQNLDAFYTTKTHLKLSFRAAKGRREAGTMTCPHNQHKH